MIDEGYPPLAVVFVPHCWDSVVCIPAKALISIISIAEQGEPQQTITTIRQTMFFRGISRACKGYVVRKMKMEHNPPKCIKRENKRKRGLGGVRRPEQGHIAPQLALKKTLEFFVQQCGGWGKFENEV